MHTAQLYTSWWPSKLPPKSTCNATEAKTEAEQRVGPSGSHLCLDTELQDHLGKTGCALGYHLARLDTQPHLKAIHA